MTRDVATRARPEQVLHIGARLGQLITEALLAAVADPDLAGNLPIPVLCHPGAPGSERP